MSGQTWRIAVDPGTCIGSGMCAGSRPDLFALTGEHATVLADEVTPDEFVLDVADMCPVAAITVHDATGTELAPR